MSSVTLCDFLEYLCIGSKLNVIIGLNNNYLEMFPLQT